MSLLALLLLLAAEPRPAAEATELPKPPYQLVLLDARRLTLLEAPRWAFGQASVTIAGGGRLTLSYHEVDHEASRQANPDWAATAKSRVFTEADLAELRKERLNLSPGSGGGELGAMAPPGTETLAQPRKQARSEAEWRAIAVPLVSEISELERQLEHLDRARQSWESFTLGTGGYQAAAAQELGKIRRARESAETRLEQARGSWARLQEDARTSGALPGWLR